MAEMIILTTNRFQHIITIIHVLGSTLVLVNVKDYCLNYSRCLSVVASANFPYVYRSVSQSNTWIDIKHGHTKESLRQLNNKICIRNVWNKVMKY